VKTFLKLKRSWGAIRWKMLIIFVFFSVISMILDVVPRMQEAGAGLGLNGNACALKVSGWEKPTEGTGPRIPVKVEYGIHSTQFFLRLFSRLFDGHLGDIVENCRLPLASNRTVWPE